MANYLTIGIVTGETLFFLLETTTLKPTISIAVQKGLKGRFAQAHTNRDFLKKCGEKTNYKFVNTPQISTLHINIL